MNMIVPMYITYMDVVYTFAPLYALCAPLYSLYLCKINCDIKT